MPLTKSWFISISFILAAAILFKCTINQLIVGNAHVPANYKTVDVTRGS